MKSREEILEKIIEDSFFIIINLSDTFYYACADSEKIEGEDYIELIPLIEKYGYYAEVAYCAIKRGHDPQVKSVLTKEYYLAKDEILNMLTNGNKYVPFYGLTQAIEKDESTDWKDLIKKYIKIEKTIDYKSIPDLLTSINCGSNCIIGNEELGHYIKIHSFSKTLAIVENVKYKGKDATGYEYVLEFYELLKLIKKNNYIKVDIHQNERKRLTEEEKKLFEDLIKKEED
jgi:hypothetical protein